MQKLRAILFSCVVLLFGSFTARAGEIERWADRGLAVRDGLTLWLDASRLPASWESHGKPVLFTEAPLDVWYDGSGTGLDLVQRSKDAQPRYVTVGSADASAGTASMRALVRFDGKDDFLAALQAGRTLTEFTAFLVVAPRSNAGGFRAFMAANQTGKNDYLTGFTVDMSWPASDRFSQLNIEGFGFGGATNLLDAPVDFGQFRTVEIACAPGDGGVTLTVDGRPAGRRKREPGKLFMDGLSIGARCYSNSTDPPFMSGFLDGDIAEVLVYGRVLAAEERADVRKYLSKKHAGLSEAVASADLHGGRILKPIADPPPVQMLVPGFTVRELPLKLTNLNNVRYRPDGKLFALGYNGNIFVLSDSDGDGLEDKLEMFWENKGRLRGPIGIALTPPGYKQGSGLFVASTGKLSLIVDTDGDDRADHEIVVATGWTEIPQNVDAIGVALAQDGSIYFALGTANYANGYLLDEQGKSHYDLKSERGTVLRVSPDFSRREIVCTGTRFPVSMAFNRLGDLFASEQEGATWLPNGNPFDELLHIQPGRHYGFPPAHPRHLPGVIDEPSVFDYGPQHQSTCGMLFNEPVNGGPTFGPVSWAGDAILCGESRGKLFRTRLVKTPTGYIARNETIACLGMLTVDACLSPAGDLVVACHSGPPDWGTGPEGFGKLYKIHYERLTPQPVAAWPTGPREVRIAFDGPLDPLQLKNLMKQSAIEFGPYVRAGDRFETLKPPYAVVQRQLATPRFDLPILSAQVTPDNRTLVLATAAQLDAVDYAVTLPGLGRERSQTESVGQAGSLPQHAAIDIGYDLTGVEASWQAKSDSSRWSGWLPHVDLAAARTFTTGSAEHDALWPLLTKPGSLTLRTKLDLWHVLRPAVQPGSSLDYTPAPEEVTVTIRSSHPLQVRSAAATATAAKKDATFVAKLTTTPREGDWLPIEIELATDRTVPRLELSFATNEDPRERPLPLRRIRLPWTNARPAPPSPLAREVIPELEGGNWLRGREIFLSEKAACANCHQLRGLGGRIGPDLGNLPHRDYASVLRDILEPSATINPDHISYSAALKNGQIITGVPVASDSEKIVLADSTAKEITVARADIEELKASAVSGMPANLRELLSAEQLRDLMTFLLVEPLAPAPLDRRDAPPPRTRADFERVLKTVDHSLAASPRKLHIALVAGPKDHGPDEHDYPLWQRRWTNLLGLGENIEVSEAMGWPTAAQLESADVIAFFSANPAWSADKAGDLDRFLARGGGLVYLHFAVNGGKDSKELAERIGLVANSGISFRHGPLDLDFTDPKHPITRGFDRATGLARVHFVDESYWKMIGDPNRIHVLATTVEEGQPRPLLWTVEHGKGRVFVSILGHYTWTFDDPLFRSLVLRGMMWTVREPADRLVDLSTIGARIAP